MYNWSTNEQELKKDSEQYALWQLEQTVNFGLNGSKLSEVLLKTHWSKLSLDPARRRFLSLLIYGHVNSE